MSLPARKPTAAEVRGMMKAFDPLPPHDGISRDLIKAMAMDAGKSLCAYIEVMFPQVWHSQNSGFKISMKHHVYNDIMALADLHDEAAIRKRLAENEAHRNAWVGGYRKMRRKKCEHGIREIDCGLCDDAKRNRTPKKEAL